MTANMLDEIAVCGGGVSHGGGVAFADLITDGHRETWPIRSKRFRTWLRRCYYRATGAAPGAAAIGSALDLLEARARNLMLPSGRSICVSPSMPAGCILILLILPTSIGVRLRLIATVGKWLAAHQCGFVAPPECCRYPSQSANGRRSAAVLQANQNDFLLVVARLLAALRKRGPYPLLAISG